MGAGGSNMGAGSSNLKTFFIVTEKELVGIDFKQLLLQPEWTTTQVPNVAPIRVTINLLNLFGGKSIVGMKHVALDSNVFLLGGEFLESGAIPTKGYVSNHPESYLGSSNQVLQLSCEKNTFRLKRTTRMKKFLYGKCCPMVENIKGKIYVLEDKPYLQNHHLNGPFEVYDQDREYSRPLSNPPPYARYPQGKIEGHVVLGDKFVVFEKRSNGEIDGYFYDTHRAGEWERLDPYIVFLFAQGCLLPLPINAMCVPFFPKLKRLGIELVLSRKGIEEGYAMLINASSSMLLFYQPLVEFRRHFPLMETGERAHLNNGRNFFFVLPNNQICAIWIAFDHHKMLRLFVTIFTLEFCFDPTTMPSNRSSSSSPPTEKKFLKVSNIHTWDSVVRKDGASSNHIFDAFFHRK
ncbi:hypothetical protein VNO77_30457 [Canavalia gladiata]|uniref:Uncharacterized protein n=1 Tax=Canavalia gladiata TaxID=3824 RepID=A0AAN9KRV4_CANGL